MNIDTPLNNGELSTKLSKINKIIAEMTHQTPRDIKTMISKGQLDNYRLLIEQSIFRLNSVTRNEFLSLPPNKAREDFNPRSKTKGTQVSPINTNSLPHIIVFDECNQQLHQTLRDYSIKGLIQLDSISIFSDKEFAHQKLSLDSLIKTINPNTCLICFSIVDEITGKYLINTHMINLIRQLKDKYSDIDFYLDLTQGLRNTHNVTNTSSNAFPFDFWSFSSNQIHSSDKTAIMGFKTHLSKRWNRFSSYIQRASNTKSSVHATNELPAVLNSLTVYLCNRDMKNKRIQYLKSSLLNALYSYNMIYNLHQFSFKLPSDLLLYLHEEMRKQTPQEHQRLEKPKKNPCKSLQNEACKQQSLVLFNCQKPNKHCIQDNTILLLIMNKQNKKITPVSKSRLLDCLNKYQVLIDFIDPRRIFELKIGELNDFSIVQLTLNDLSFGFMIKQFTEALQLFRH